MAENRFWKTVKSYKQKSVFIRQLYFMLLIVVVPTMIIYSAFAVYFNRSYEEKLTTNAKFTADAIESSYTASLDAVNNLSLILSTDKKVQAYLLKESSGNSVDVSEDAAYISSLLTSLSHSINCLNSVYIYKPLNNYVMSVNSSNYLGLFQDIRWYTLYTENGRQNYSQTRVMSTYQGDKPVYTIVKNINNGNSSIGIIVLNIDISALYSDLKNGYEYLDSLYIASPDGKITVAEDLSLIGSYINGISVGEPGVHKSHIITKTENADFIIITDIINSTANQSHFIAVMIAAIFIVLLLGLFLISYIVSKRFYNNILDIIQMLNEKSDISPAGISSNEFQYISNNIFNMRREYETAENQLAESLALLKRSQLRALQNQINPHFVFNTLNLISLKDRAENREQTEISQIVLLLSDILRPLFSSPNYIASFETELDYLEKYIRLQNIKYDGRFNLRVSCPPEIKNPVVLRFSFQPIVENAITHGILPLKDSDGTIDIDMARDAGNLIIRIADYGVILPEEKIKQLNSDINNQDYVSKHVGLQNVNQRIKLVFGEAYGISISSGESDVTVTYTIPYTEYDDFSQ